MAALLVMRQYSDPCMSGSFSAASARGKKKELTGWALGRHSPQSD
jgi:hypothetical protein